MTADRHLRWEAFEISRPFSHAALPGRLKFAESTLRAHGFKPRQIRKHAIFFEWLRRLGTVARRAHVAS